MVRKKVGVSVRSEMIMMIKKLCVERRGRVNKRLCIVKENR